MKYTISMALSCGIFSLLSMEPGNNNNNSAFLPYKKFSGQREIEEKERVNIGLAQIRKYIDTKSGEELEELFKRETKGKDLWEVLCENPDHKDVVERLLAKETTDDNLSERQERYGCFAWGAALRANDKAFKLFIEHGALISKKSGEEEIWIDNNNNTVLMAAIDDGSLVSFSERSVRIIEHILARPEGKTLINCTNKKGETALDRAFVKRNNMNKEDMNQAIAFLIQHGGMSNFSHEQLDFFVKERESVQSAKRKKVRTLARTLSEIERYDPDRTKIVDYYMALNGLSQEENDDNDNTGLDGRISPHSALLIACQVEGVDEETQKRMVAQGLLSSSEEEEDSE